MLYRKRTTYKLREGLQASSVDASKNSSREASRPASGKGHEYNGVKKAQPIAIGTPNKLTSRPTTASNRPTTPGKKFSGGTNLNQIIKGQHTGAVKEAVECKHAQVP